MYAGDSFFTLTVWGQAGLLAVSGLFALAALGLTRVLVRHRPLVTRVPVWAFVFLVFVWASPQGYYTYYRAIIPDLPAQWVIDGLPRPEMLLALLTFRGPATLSAHSLGALGWAMLVAALWPHRRKCRDAAN